MKYIRKILSKLFVAIVCVCLSFSAIGATTAPGSIGDYGTWTTEENVGRFIESLNGDLSQLEESFRRQMVRDYVPIEARLGIAMIHGLDQVAKILDSSLVRFIVIFMLVMYAFWIMFEAYNFMSKGGTNAEKLVTDILKKAIMIAIWITILEIGPAKLFMMVMGPVISIGTFLSDFILNAVAAVSGAVLPDTCDAIHQFVATNTPDNMLFDANAAASLMCLPTRLSGFFTSAIAAGWTWMVGGIGHSTFSFVVGAIFTCVFLWDAFKFAFMALGVVMDLFLGIIMLPFTALAETIPQTSYKGLAGNIFNGFIKLFNTGPVKLDAQINRFINAAVYFVSLSIVIAICAALLYGVIGSDLTAQVPTLDNDGFIPALLTGLLVGYLATQADKIAKDIGGSVDTKSWGDKFTGDMKTWTNDAKQQAKSWIEAIKKSRS